MKNKYILSIAIPAYGYPEALKKSVISLLTIPRKDIEIVVVDNDPTGGQIGAFAEGIEDERFCYYRNESNIGRSANIAKAAQMATADYVLLASCDDLIRNEAIDIIINKIEQNYGCAIIMGKIKTNLGSIKGYQGEEKVYQKGYAALSVSPHMGTLYPFVVNKNYLDFHKLYSQKETYMQTRILYSAVEKGSFVGITEIVAEVVDLLDYRNEDKKPGCFDLEKCQEIKKMWDVEECYYSPQARAEQVIKDIETIENFKIRRSHKLKIIDNYVQRHFYYSVSYVACCHDPHLINNGGSVGFLTCEEAMDNFQKVLEPFFKKRADAGEYYYSGTLLDKLQNERVLLEEIRIIKDKILNCGEVYVYKNNNLKNMQHILNLMNIEMTDDYDGKLVLVAGAYDDDIEKKMLEDGAGEVVFFELFAQYLAIVWTEDLKGDNVFGAYAAIF